MATQDHIDELVRLALAFDRFKAMGMIGSSGKLANAEASRMNNRIIEKRKALGIDNKTLDLLKKEAIQSGETFY